MKFGLITVIYLLIIAAMISLQGIRGLAPNKRHLWHKCRACEDRAHLPKKKMGKQKSLPLFVSYRLEWSSLFNCVGGYRSFSSRLGCFSLDSSSSCRTRFCRCFSMAIRRGSCRFSRGWRVKVKPISRRSCSRCSGPITSLHTAS